MLTDGTLVLCILLFMRQNWEDWMKEWQDVKILLACSSRKGIVLTSSSLSFRWLLRERMVNLRFGRGQGKAAR